MNEEGILFDDLSYRFLTFCPGDDTPRSGESICLKRGSSRDHSASADMLHDQEHGSQQSEDLFVIEEEDIHITPNWYCGSERSGSSLCILGVYIIKKLLSGL